MREKVIIDERDLYKQIRADIGHILSELCKRKGVEIIAAECIAKAHGYDLEELLEKWEQEDEGEDDDAITD